MASDGITTKLSKASEANVIRKINKLLEGSRKEAPKIVKQLARMASNSAAKLTIPNTGKNRDSGKGRSVRRPTMADKFRPLVKSSTAFHGNFYVVNSVTRRKGKRKTRKGSKFSTGENGQRRVMAGSRGELVIYTKKKMSQKDGRFTKVKKLIKIYDKKRRSWKYVPTMATGKYDKASPRFGKIPNYFTAKMAWLFAAAPISKSIQKLNPKARNHGSMINKLSNKDNPSVTLRNKSKYAHKRGGQTVPRRALVKAYRGYQKMLEKHRQNIINKARRG